MKNFFKPEDFENDGGFEAYADREIAADFANEKLNKLIKSWPLVFGWKYSASDKWAFDQEKTDITTTHQARLAFIEPLPCQHKFTKIFEPHLAGARKCLDCGFEKYSTSGPWVKEPCKHEPNVLNQKLGGWYCKHCDLEIEAEWKPKK